MLIDRIGQLLLAAVAGFRTPPEPAPPAAVEVPRPSDEAVLRNLHGRRIAIENRIAHIRGRIAKADSDLVLARAELHLVNHDIESVERGQVTW
jgi:hypothetical protein